LFFVCVKNKKNGRYKKKKEPKSVITGLLIKTNDIAKFDLKGNKYQMITKHIK